LLADLRHVGLQNFAPYGKLKYEVGYLFGLTQATPSGTVRWRLEYEIPFLIPTHFGA
jgi:hypothetical protein